MKTIHDFPGIRCLQYIKSFTWKESLFFFFLSKDVYSWSLSILEPFSVVLYNILEIDPVL